MKKRIHVIIILLVVCVPLSSQEDSLRAIAFINATIIPGVDTSVLENHSLLIQGDRIVAIGKELNLPADTEVIDCTGSTLLPGLIDMHGHLYGNTGGVIESLFDSYPALYLAGGVTTTFSPGEFDPEGSIALRERVKSEQQPGPHILTAGPYFDLAPSQVPWIKGVKTIEAARDQFRAWKDRIDGVKFYTSITREQMRTVLVEAREAGLPVTGHLASVPAGVAIEMGITGLEHGIYGMSEFWPEGAEYTERFCALAAVDIMSPKVQELIGMIVEHQIYIDPTIIIMEAGFPDFQPVTQDWESYLEPSTLDRFQKMDNDQNQFLDSTTLACQKIALNKQKQFVKALYDAGGILVVGTDPVMINVIPGFGLHREMANLVAAGIPAVEAIKAATYNAAQALNIDGETGSLSVGKRADLVLVTGRPDRIIDDIGNTELVVKAGKRYDPEDLRTSMKGMIGRRNPDLYRKDILRALEKIFQYTEGMDQESFAADEKTQEAVLQNLLTVSLAAEKMPQGWQERYPGVPWQVLSDFKTYLLDQYYAIEGVFFWYAIEHFLPQVNRTLKAKEGNGN